jgi:hypothetical protein
MLLLLLELLSVHLYPAVLCSGSRPLPDLWLLQFS